MRKIFTTAALAVIAGMTTVVNAQNKNMVIHYSDGTTKQYKVEDIDSLTFEQKKESQQIALTIDELHEVWAQYTSKAEDPSMTYNVMYLEKSEFDKYASDEDVIEDDIKYFQELADGYGMELSDIIGMYAIDGSYSADGSWTDWLCDLKPNSEYVIWYYGLDLDGTVTTPMYKNTFKTPAVEKIANKIAINVISEEDIMTVMYTPDTDDMRYTCGYMVKEGENTDEEILNMMQESVSAPFYDYLANGESVTSAIEANTENGTTSIIMERGDESTQYYALAAFVNENGAINSDIFKIAFNGSGATVSAVKGKKTLKQIKTDKKPAKVKRHLGRHSAKK